uniref:Uncharacterized protein n=1 Tax=Cacopsylla melanoneura TaxID=428564 RepID=A0A8D9DWS7_9HEMI
MQPEEVMSFPSFCTVITTTINISSRPFNISVTNNRAVGLSMSPACLCIGFTKAGDFICKSPPPPRIYTHPPCPPLRKSFFGLSNFLFNYHWWTFIFSPP